MSSLDFPASPAVRERSGSARPPVRWILRSLLAVPMLASIGIELAGLYGPSAGQLTLPTLQAFGSTGGLDLPFLIWFMAPLVAVALYLVNASWRAPCAVPTAFLGSMAFLVVTAFAVVSSRESQSPGLGSVLLLLPVLQVATLLALRHVIATQALLRDLLTGGGPDAMTQSKCNPSVRSRLSSKK